MGNLMTPGLTRDKLLGDLRAKVPFSAPRQLLPAIFYHHTPPNCLWSDPQAKWWMPNEWAHPIPVRRVSAVHIATRSPGKRRLALSTPNRPWDVGLLSSQEILHDICIYTTDYTCIQHTGILWWRRHSLKNYFNKCLRNWLETLEQKSLHISTLFPVSSLVRALRCSKCQQPQCGPTIRVAMLRRCVVRCRCEVSGIHRPQLLAISFVESVVLVSI